MRSAATWGVAIGLLGSPTLAVAGPPEPAPLPKYDEVAPPPPVVPVVHPETQIGPPTGIGGTVAGAVLLGGGAVLFGLSTWRLVEAVNTPPQGDELIGEETLWFPLAFLGATSMTAGAIVGGVGIHKHRTYREWERHQVGKPIPLRGEGMLAGGIISVCAGLNMGIFTLVLVQDRPLRPYPAHGIALLSTSAVALVGGTGLVIGGGLQNRKYMRWKKARLTPSLSPLPGPRASVGGLSIGLAGRF